MTNSHRHMFTAVAMATLLAAAPALADVKAGVDAWQAGKYEQALKEWRPLADRGDADAQFNMGQAYRLGRGVPADLKIAQSWFEKAGAQGHQEAQANAGLLLFQNGNRPAAMPWLRKAADRGDARAQYVLGTALFNGDVDGKDWPRAYALMSRAAAQGLPQAKTSLTQMEQFVSADDKQKSSAIAAQLAKGAAISAVSSTASLVRDNRPVRIAGQAQTRPTMKPVTPPAKTPTLKDTTSPTVLATAKGDAPGDKSKAAAAQAAKIAAKPAQAAKIAAKPAPAAKPVAVTARPAAALASPGGRWRVQLGAFGNAGAARAQWANLSKRVGAFGSLQPSYEQAGAITRLRVGPLADRAAAARVCAAAKAASQACFPVAP